MQLCSSSEPTGATIPRQNLVTKVLRISPNLNSPLMIGLSRLCPYLFHDHHVALSSQTDPLQQCLFHQAFNCYRLWLLVKFWHVLAVLIGLNVNGVLGRTRVAPPIYLPRGA